MPSSRSAESSSSPAEQAIAGVRRGIERWNEGNWEAALAGMEPDVEWEIGDELLGFDPVYRGHDGVRRFWAAWVETWQSMQIDIEKIGQNGADVWVYARFRARGREGLEIDQAVVFQFTGGPSGRLRRFQTYWNRDDAPVDARTTLGDSE